MDAGVQMTFTGHGWPGARDSQVYEEEIRLALIAADAGFDVLWSAEHHFFDYAFCPDSLELLAYLVGRTNSSIDVGTAAVIMPWHDPLRVAEKVAMLDHLSGGRLRFGMGRGLSRQEFEGFRGIRMEESRDRFDEAAAMVVNALDSGWIEGDGPFYPQARREIRPRPERSFADRLYAVAGSDESIDAAVRIKARMLMFADRAWDQRLPSIERYWKGFAEVHGEPAPPMVTADFTVCLASETEANEVAEHYLAVYLTSVLDHYEMMGDHFDATQGYEGYAKAAEQLRNMGKAGHLKSFMNAAAYGTPDQVLATLQKRRDLLGPIELMTTFRFGGIPIATAERSLRLFAAEVLPVLKTWD